MSTTPTSLGTFHSLGYYKSRTAQIFREAAAFSRDDLDHALGPELDCDGLFDATPSALFDTSASPRTSCFPSSYYCDPMSNRTSTTSSSRTITPSSILITPSQTPLGLHPTAFPAAPSPLCLGPSLRRTHPENDLEDVCLDETCDDGNNVGEDDGLPEPTLITPPQTPLGPHPTSFPAVPSPLCLGPSLCRTHPETDLEDVCLDEAFDDGSNVDEDDELPELVTPQTSCFPSSYYCDPMSNRTSTTSSSRTITPSSILITPSQTPLCLGPSLCRIPPENDLEDICLDEPFDDGNNVDEDDELPELVTPQTSCFPSSYYCDLMSNRTSTTSSSHTITPSSILITPPQTPLCLGPSLCRTHPDNDLEDVCLDEPFDDGNNVDEDDELPEFITPISAMPVLPL